MFQRKIFSFTQHYEAPSSVVFPLLCPERETEWVEPWKYDMIYSKSGYAELDCVFTTGFKSDGSFDTWVITRHEPDNLIEFVRFNSLRTIRYTIAIEDDGDGKCKSEWSQVITALSDEGSKFLETCTHEKFNRDMHLSEKMLNHYLKTGEALGLKDIENKYH